jgi:hypothetical protein
MARKKAIFTRGRKGTKKGSWLVLLIKKEIEETQTSSHTEAQRHGEGRKIRLPAGVALFLAIV